jgi:flagellar FliJ protein
MKERFRLATLLRVRERELEQAGASYGRAARELQAAGALARERAQRAARGRESLLRRSREGESAIELRTATAGVRRLGDTSVDAQQQVERARAETERAQESLLAARTRLRVLERLRDRLALEEHAALERAEQRELDEIGLRRFGRRGLSR